jgi:murein DD-endopeptidase MepM/ murein hydrolase activator NlpD
MTRIALVALLATALSGAASAPRSPSIAVSIDARAQQPGELVLLTMTVPARASHVRVQAFGHELTPYPAGDGEWRALVGIDLDVTPGRYPVAIEADDARTTYDLVVVPKKFLTRRLTVDEAFVTPPASAAERIAQDAQLLDRAWKSSAPDRLWADRFVRPVSAPANSAFGTRSIFNGKARSPHGGADFLSPAGTPVHAPNAGRVVVARDLYYSGHTVIIDHGLGLFSMLAHFSAIDVHEGDRVIPGQVVGRVGATGRVTGAHLHWAVRAGGARVDPLSLLALLGPPETGR